MTNKINIYCDESCYLEYDKCPSMVLGAIICPQIYVKELSRKIKDIKKKYKIPTTSEIKWTKISKSKEKLYLELIDLFCQVPYVRFRAVKAINKEHLHHSDFKSSHDDWYYRMYYILLIYIIEYKNDEFFTYIDIKDTKSSQKRNRLKECIANTYNKEDTVGEKIADRIKNIQAVRSEESQLLQLADILIGATGYEERISKIKQEKPSFEPSETKLNICKYIKKSLRITSFEENIRSSKYNLFIWSPDYKRATNA